MRVNPFWAVFVPRFLWFFAILLIKADGLLAQSLHALVVCDTHAVAIGPGVQIDCSHILGEIHRICKYTKLKPKVQKFTGFQVETSFLRALEAIVVEHDDVILFYWSGHGKRINSQEDPFPLLDFEHDDASLSQYQITEKIMEKRPRLILSIADCCNNFEESFLTDTDVKIHAKGKEKKYIKENYQTLYCDSHGTYIVAAASPGEYALALNGDNRYLNLRGGSFFTNALLEVIKNETNHKNREVCWDLIFEKAIAKTIDYQLQERVGDIIYHTPQYIYIDHW